MGLGRSCFSAFAHLLFAIRQTTVAAGSWTSFEILYWDFLTNQSVSRRFISTLARLNTIALRDCENRYVRKDRFPTKPH